MYASRMPKKQVLKLTIKEAAEYLGAPVWKVKQWRRNGKFPNATLTSTARGDVWEIPQTDLDNFEPPKVGRPRTSKTARKRIT